MLKRMSLRFPVALQLECRKDSGTCSKLLKTLLSMSSKHIAKSEIQATDT